MIYNELLNLLNMNKRFPHYAAERRIDIFINIFLEDILTLHYGETINFVAPEFPLKHSSNQLSDKLDYLCVFEKTKQPLFVELKTDPNSLHKKEAQCYKKQIHDWASCIENLSKIISSPSMRYSYRVKYFHLIESLHRARLIEIDIDILNNLSELYISQVDKNPRKEQKAEFSKAFKQLYKHKPINAHKKCSSRLLYLGPSKLSKEINEMYNGEAELLSFEQVEKLELGPDHPYSEEFKMLMQHLKKY